jgi:8-oxo-dGTP pyrophosphatase MutT (NUDIX family)
MTTRRVPLAKSVVFTTPWFRVVAKTMPGEAEPYYGLELSDYVSVVATTPANELVVVRQFRPIVEAHTLELPSGHLEPAEAPEIAAGRELFEETGYEAKHIETLSVPLFSDTGRLTNRMWGFRARNVRLTEKPRKAEPGIETLLLSPTELRERIRSGEFIHALHLALLFVGDFDVDGRAES